MWWKRANLSRIICPFWNVWFVSHTHCRLTFAVGKFVVRRKVDPLFAKFARTRSTSPVFKCCWRTKINKKFRRTKQSNNKNHQNKNIIKDTITWRVCLDKIMSYFPIGSATISCTCKVLKPRHNLYISDSFASQPQNSKAFLQTSSCDPQHCQGQCRTQWISHQSCKFALLEEDPCITSCKK